MLDCPECGKLFPRRSSWKRHLRTHYEGRAFICPLCGKGLVHFHQRLKVQKFGRMADVKMSRATLNSRKVNKL